MFNDKFKGVIEMFSMPHILALLVFIGITVLFFVFRNKFKESEKADKIFRYTTASLMIALEIGLHIFSYIKKDWTFAQHLPLELCAIIMWTVALALFTNNAKIMKIVYYWGLLGGILSLIVIDMQYVFPHARAFQFFISHYLLILGPLYFAFTDKIKTFTYKDLLKSCLVLLCVALPVLVIDIIFNLNYMFLFKAPDAIAFISDALGIFWTPLFMLVVFGLFNLFWIISNKLKGKKGIVKEEIKNVEEIVESEKNSG